MALTFRFQITGNLDKYFKENPNENVFVTALDVNGDAKVRESQVASERH